MELSAKRALDSELSGLPAQVLTRLGGGKGRGGGRGRHGLYRLAEKCHQEAVNEPGEDNRPVNRRTEKMGAQNGLEHSGFLEEE